MKIKSKRKANKSVHINAKKVSHKKQSNIEQSKETDTTETVPQNDEERPITNVPGLEAMKKELKNAKYASSKRQQKKERFLELQKTKKIESDLSMQKDALNYLSLWKHNRNDWKFKKMRQVWLQKHIFDDVLIPSDYWEMAAEYFNSSKGKVRESIMDTCTKLMESNVSEQDQANNTTYERARYLLQLLEE